MIKDRPIHAWFELSYAEYLTIPRSVLQSMPLDWQERFVACLNELDDLIDWRPDDGTYRVRMHTIIDGEWGPEIPDPLMDYERGRRRLPLQCDEPLVNRGDRETVMPSSDGHEVTVQAGKGMVVTMSGPKIVDPDDWFGLCYGNQ